MSIELNPVGSQCNIACGYCYEHPQRDAGHFNDAGALDFEAAIAALEAEGVGASDGRGGTTGFALHGGEPLLTPFDDLERLARWAYAKGAPLAIQSNGTLLSARHLDLFARYQVHVGISMDGPGALNDSRWAGSLEKTRLMTARTEAALRALQDRQMPHSLIVTLYRGNVANEALAALGAWFAEQDRRGTQHARLHALEVDHPLIRGQALTTAEALHAFQWLAGLERTFERLRFDVFEDLRRLLLGRDNDGVTCVFNPCDPLSTNAVRGVDAKGHRSNCGRTYKDGIPMLKGDVAGHERQIALYHTPQAHGGCQDCRFFFACKGYCPGTAIDGDWRNRTEHCALIVGLCEHVEASLLNGPDPPLSLAPDRTQVEARLLAAWAMGGDLSVQDARAGKTAGVLVTNGHGDHYDAPDGHTHADGVTWIHGDHGTTEMHGDSDHPGRPA